MNISKSEFLDDRSVDQSKIQLQSIEMKQLEGSLGMRIPSLEDGLQIKHREKNIHEKEQNEDLKSTEIVDQNRASATSKKSDDQQNLLNKRQSKDHSQKHISNISFDPNRTNKLVSSEFKKFKKMHHTQQRKQLLKSNSDDKIPLIFAANHNL